jgi:hypothetical protein
MVVSSGGSVKNSRVRLVFITFLTICGIYAVIAASRGLFSPQPSTHNEEEIRVAVAAVGKLMDLPSEKPTVATVKDVTQLPLNQPFFVAAKNGDTVLFYNDAKKAILYRPETDKIINVSPINANPIEIH